MEEANSLKGHIRVHSVTGHPMTNTEKQCISPSPDLHAHTALPAITDGQGEHGKKVKDCREAEGEGSCPVQSQRGGGEEWSAGISPQYVES